MNGMALTSFTWDRVGPRREERVLAGRVAGALWLTVLPMVAVSLVLPGSMSSRSPLILLLTIPALAWGAACMVIRWERVGTPLLFHVPAALALPYIGTLVALTGAEQSPFGLTLLMLIGFCAYFFRPRATVPYLVGSLVVLSFPLIYAKGAFQTELASQLWVATFVYAAVGGVIMIGKQQLLAARDQARELSLHDSLTGLSNRRALTELLEARFDGERESDSLGLVLIDLDDFKDANTLYGLLGGDTVLTAVADALRSTSRDEDMVVRLGGDEFAIVARGVSEPGMEHLAQRALEQVDRASSRLDLPGIRITASAGWAVYPDNAQSTVELLSIADLSLRAAKASGKNRSHSPAIRIAELAAG
jgi:diguanylate cyclase (GGDEF)-like protein